MKPRVASSKLAMARNTSFAEATWRNWSRAMAWMCSAWMRQTQSGHVFFEVLDIAKAKDDQYDIAVEV